MLRQRANPPLEVCVTGKSPIKDTERAPPHSVGE